MAGDEHGQTFTLTTAPWSDDAHIYPHSSHGTPAQEYQGFNFTPSAYALDAPSYSAANTGRQGDQEHHLSNNPPWPSMLTSHSMSQQPQMSSAADRPPLPTPTAILPAQTSAKPSRPGLTPRRTLTDSDRKRMCEYAKEHPDSKQTEIGAVFGVERSTVSKVLRQKEKFLLQDTGSKSPSKRSKPQSPTLERTLAVWAKNQLKKDVSLSDDMIIDRARAFLATATSSESQQVLSSGWLEKFKLKNNLMGPRSVKGSPGPDDTESSTAASSTQSPQESLPISPQHLRSPSPRFLSGARSQESLAEQDARGLFNLTTRSAAFRTYDASSLITDFTDTASSAFSPDVLSSTSSLFTPESGTSSGAFALHLPSTLPTTSLASTPRALASSVQHSPRFQPSSVKTENPSLGASEFFDSPMEEPAESPATHDREMETDIPHRDQRPLTVAPAETMRPPPVPSRSPAAGKLKRVKGSNASPRSSKSSAISIGEARQAMEVVLSFFAQQPHGYLDLQESVTIGKLMEKLKPLTRSDMGRQSKRNSVTMGESPH